MSLIRIIVIATLIAWGWVNIQDIHRSEEISKEIINETGASNQENRKDTE